MPHVPNRYNSRTGKYDILTKTRKPSKGKLRALKQKTQSIRRKLKNEKSAN